MAETALALALASLVLDVFLGIWLPRLYFRAMAERFSYLSHFPYELYGGTFRGANPVLKETLQWLSSLLTSGGAAFAFLVLASLLGGNASLFALAVVGLLLSVSGGIFESLLFSHGDLAYEKRHLAFGLLHAGSVALSSAIGGILLVQFYLQATDRLAGALVTAVLLFLLAIASMLPELNPKAGKGLKVEKIEDPSGVDLYVRPGKNPLAAGEWLVIAIRLAVSLVLSSAALYLCLVIPTFG